MHLTRLKCRERMILGAKATCYPAASFATGLDIALKTKNVKKIKKRMLNQQHQKFIV